MLLNKTVLKHLLIVVLSTLPLAVFGETITLNANTQLRGEFTQGGLIRGKTLANSQVTLDGKTIRTTPNGQFAFGFGRNTARTSKIAITPPSGKMLSHTLKVHPRNYKLQKIDGVPQKTVTPPKSVLGRIKKETQLVKAARKTDSNATDFLSTFQWPLIGPITGVYGSQRIYNGTPKRPHYGLDIAAPVGTEVRAPTDVTITLAHQNMYYSGGTLIMDHGYGISSTFIHLDEVLVKVGDKIKQGDIVAKVGSKGRSTGPHLDWRINWFGVRLDPALIMPDMPTPQKK
ncbi:peptidase [Gammaproteobacteria bacterium 42_54_T18]|nr:peptidase [Gammaproteobacteria bacterium 42_54_T18]